MINFASLFGGINRTANSAVNDLLDKPDTSLQQLLDLESFLNQYKSNNAKVNEFMKYDKYAGLVNYVTVQGPANDQKKGFKFPMVAADVLSVEKDLAIELFLPDGVIQVDVNYQSTEQIQFQVDDSDEQYLTEQAEQNQLESEKVNFEKPNQIIEIEGEQKPIENKEIVKKTKIVRQIRPVIKNKKIQKEPLMEKLLSYFEGPVNYTLAGYTCKVLSTLFTKKPASFFKFLFNSNKNYVQLICKHIESKSVGDVILKVLIYESVQFVKERQIFYDHLIRLLSQLKDAHVISNLAYTIHEIIEKTSVYIKSKINISNNQGIIQAFMKIFYRTEQVHKIINNTIDEDQNKSGYNCHVLHAYLHHTEIQTFNSFKLEEVLESFIKKAAEKLRIIPNKRVLGMGRVKIVEIFSFLIRKPRKTLDDENKQNDLSKELLQQLYLHEMIAEVPDFFNILLKLVQSFENNNILHNQVFKILEAVLREPQQNKSSLQQLLLNDENVLLKFILLEAEIDKESKKEKNSRRKGYIGHVINLCKLIQQIENNQLLNQKIKQSSQFIQVLNTLVAADLIETNKNLAGYQMKKNPVHQIMFQKQDILAAYSQFLIHCPKPVFEEEKESVAETPAEHQAKLAEQRAQQQLQQQQLDEQKFNEVVAVSEQLNQSQPTFWRNHLNYDVDSLMQDL